MKRKPIDVATSPHSLNGWLGTTAFTLGGANLSIIVIGALLNSQGTATIPLLIIGFLVSCLAAPGLLELVLMYPNKVGGITNACTEAFRPYNPIITNILGVCYWLAWMPAASFAAMLAATIIQHLFLSGISVPLLSTLIILCMTGVHLCGLRWAQRLAIPIAVIGASLAILSAFIPIFTGQVNWQQALTYKLNIPFTGMFGQLTSIMSGLFLIGYVAPAYELALSCVGHTNNPGKNIPRAMLASGLVAAVYFVLCPLVWLGVLGSEPLIKDSLWTTLSPTYAVLFHNFAFLAAAWFMIFNMLIAVIAILTNTPRTLFQLSIDGLAPRFLQKNSNNNVPITSLLITSLAAIIIIWLGGTPVWMMAATNFGYLLCISLASIAVWLLRRNAPDAPRLYRAPKGFIYLGLLAALVWILATIFGLQQYGLKAVIIGIAFSFTGTVLYLWRKIADRLAQGITSIPRTLHIKLTGTMVAVLLFNAVAYLIAVNNVQGNPALIVVFEDIFVVVALLTLSVGLILPGMIANAAQEISNAAKRLVDGTLADFTRAMQALGRGDLDAASARIDIQAVSVTSKDEIGEMAQSFNIMQEQIREAAIGLDNARDGLAKSRRRLTETNENLETRILERTSEIEAANHELHSALDNLKEAQGQLVETAKMASLGSLVAGVAHEVNTPLGIGITATSLFKDKFQDLLSSFNCNMMKRSDLEKFFVSGDEAISVIEENLNRAAELIRSFKQTSADHSTENSRKIFLNSYLNEIIHSLSPAIKKTKLKLTIICPEILEITTYPGILFQVLTIMVMNSIMHGFEPEDEGLLKIEVMPAEDSVKIVYSDTGKGVPDELHKKIFEPFFTTRRGSGGIGLGLNIAYNRIVKNLNGTLECRNNKDKGVAFIITLPQLKTEKD